MSIRTTAKAIGGNDAKASEIAVSIRAAFNKASAEKKAEIMTDFKVGYIAGRERISLSDAEAIFEAGKGKGATKAGIKAIDRATSAWNYHVVQQAKPKGKGAEKKSTRIPPALRAAALDFLSAFHGDTLREQIESAIKVLNAMK